MSDEVAFCLPAPDAIALQEGRSILAIAPVFIQKDQSCLIYPGPLPNTLPLESYYQPNFIPTARRAIAQYEQEQSDPNKVNQKVNLWARCQRCEIVSDPAELKALSELTIWSLATLEKILKEKDCIFFLYLQVHHLTQERVIIEKQAGNCIGLHRITINAHRPEIQPVLSDHLWSERYQKILKRQPSPYPELEDLQGAIAQLNTPDSNNFDQYLQTFFGWQEAKPVNLDDPASNWKWIKDISKLANSPDGDPFEKIVRRSLVTLGFSNSLNDKKVSLDPNATGGAGGIDGYCDYPYSLVGECKASGLGKIDSYVCEQVIKLGRKHLNKEDYDDAVKIIFASGKFNSHAQKIATGDRMNVMSGEILEKLVTLHAQYPGCIDLWELKKCLEKGHFGQESDEKINDYINHVKYRLNIRTKIVLSVKQLKELEETRLRQSTPNQSSQQNQPLLFNVDKISTHYNASLKVDNKILSDATVKDLLIELSSPLTGYLGRKENTDQFYFIKDFPYSED